MFESNGKFARGHPVPKKWREKLRQLKTKPKDEKLIIKKYQDGISLNQLSKEFNFCNETIRNVLIKNNVKRRKPSSNRKRSINQNFFEVIDNEKKAWLLGFVFADGCVRKPINGYYLSIDLATKDEKLLQKINKILNSTYPINSSHNGNSVSIVIGSKKMFYDLKKHGVVERKSFFGFIPKNVPQHLINHFIRGYFDGDGWITNNSKVNYKTAMIGFIGNKNIISFINNKISSILNIKKSKEITRKKCKDYTKQIQYGKQKYVKKIAEWFYSNATIFLERKYNKFIELGVIDH